MINFSLKASDIMMIFFNSSFSYLCFGFSTFKVRGKKAPNRFSSYYSFDWALGKLLQC